MMRHDPEEFVTSAAASAERVFTYSSSYLWFRGLGGENLGGNNKYIQTLGNERRYTPAAAVARGVWSGERRRRSTEGQK